MALSKGHILCLLQLVLGTGTISSFRFLLSTYSSSGYSSKGREKGKV